jgi:hypothetical protein
MRKPTILTVLLALAVSALVSGAARGNAVLDDCGNSTTGLLTGNYTARQLAAALRALDGDASDYSNCYDAIRLRMSQLRRGGSNGGGSNGGGNDTSGGSGGGNDTSGGGFDDFGGGTTGGGTGSGSTGGGATGSGGDSSGGDATPAEEVPLATGAQAGSGAPVQLAGTSVTPTIPAALASEGNALPTPLIAFLALLGAGGLAVAGTTIGRRVLAHRRD